MDIASNNTDSSTSFNLFESEEPTNIINPVQISINDNPSTDESEEQIPNATNEKIFIRGELLKRKTYYKILLSDYKKFIKKINYYSPNAETSYEQTVLTRKSVDKTKIYNIKDTHESLYNNIKKIKKDLYFVNENFNSKILVLDGENILKSVKYQQLIKQHMAQEEYEHYFNYWYRGSDNGFIQPMTSLNLSIGDKIYLIEQLVANYLSTTNCIIMVSGKMTLDSDTKTTFINGKKSIIIPVVYNKDDIREQDDHLLLYIYYHLSRVKDCDIISGDKFKWFNHSEDYLKNFILEYNFNERKINIGISNAYTNDIIIYKNHKYQLGYYYFPFIKNIRLLVFNDGAIDDLMSNDYEKISQLISNKDYNNVIMLVMGIFIKLIEPNSDYQNNIPHLTRCSEFIVGLVSKIIYLNKSTFDDLSFILSRVGSISKKIFDKIEKYSWITLWRVIFESGDNLSSLSSLTSLTGLFGLTMGQVLADDCARDQKCNDYLANSPEYIKFKSSIDNYIFITELYLILKSMTFLLNSNKSIIKIAKLFSYIMRIYDLIENSLHKIRKISNSLTDFNKIFLTILSNHIFMKKNGFCKKDY
jgi:hypothetical protein